MARASSSIVPLRTISGRQLRSSTSKWTIDEDAGAMALTSVARPDRSLLSTTVRTAGRARATLRASRRSPVT